MIHSSRPEEMWRHQEQSPSVRSTSTALSLQRMFSGWADGSCRSSARTTGRPS